ncbi:MAG: type II secretion system F family protein [Pontiella sp.]
MDWEIIVSSVLLFLASLVFISVLVNTAKHVSYITLADGRRQERSLPISIRLVLPFCAFIPRSITESHTFEDSRNRINQRLVSGGYEGLIHPHEIIAMRILMPLGLGVLCCALLYFAFPYMPETIGKGLASRQYIIFSIILVLFGFIPDSWLKKSVKQRHRSIERALPFVLDLLTLSVESGLDFMSGIQRIIQHREIDPLGEELVRVFREIQVGRTRKEALRNMAIRVNHHDIRSVSNALIQADELGTGIGHALRVQADQIRTKRFQRAEKLGNEAPVKLLFPLTAFIFPAVFLVLLGPIILQMLVRGGF